MRSAALITSSPVLQNIENVPLAPARALHAPHFGVFCLNEHMRVRVAGCCGVCGRGYPRDYAALPLC